MGLLLLQGASDLNPRELFANNEQGLWLDPSQMSTLYQDSNGVTPCTAAGDPVGLILDQSRGGLGALGSEVVPDPTLTSTTGWVLDASWTASGGNLVADNSAQAAQTFASSPEILTQGKQYLVVIEITAITGAGGIRLDCRPTAGGTGATNHATITTTGTHRVIVNNTGANTRLALRLASNTQVTTATVASISVREVPGNHAYQTTSASRPTLARIPSSGRRNLLTYSEQLDNAAWSKTGATVTANAVANPVNGETTADAMFEVAAASTPRISFPVPVTGVQQTWSVYAKANGRDQIRIVVDGSAANSTYFTLTGSGTASPGVSSTATITSLGNGWYRCAHTTTATLSSNPYIATAESNVMIASGDNTKGVYLWGAQLETGSSATNYQKVVATTDVTESGVGDLWHLVFDGSDDSLVTNSVDFATWTQETRRNLLTETNSMIHATGFWTSIRNTDTYGQSDPFGTNLATLMVVNSENASGSPRYWQQITTTGNYRFSVYLKKYNHRYTAIQLYNTVCYVDFDTGTISGSGTIQDVGNGWFRVSMTANMAAAGYCYVYSATGAATISAIGLNTLGCYCFGGQLESGTAAATGYQPVGTDEMTVIAGVRKLLQATEQIYELSANSFGNNGSFGLNNSASSLLSCSSMGTVSAGLNAPAGSTVPPKTLVSTLISDISDDNLAMRENGTQVASSSSNQGAGNFGNYQFFIGRRNQATVPFNGHLYQLIVRGKTTPTGKLLEAEKFVSKKTGVSF